jgi:hypothetical protein
MLGLKDLKDLDEYIYRVCEISSCEYEATNIYTTMEDRVIDLCDIHYKSVSSETLW